MSLKRNIWLTYINGIELQYMLNICWIILFEQVIAIWLVGFNLTFDVHKKAWTFTLLNPHYTVIMALAFRIVVNKKKAVMHLLPASLVYSKSVHRVFIALFVEYLYAFFYVIICVYTCWKPVVLEKRDNLIGAPRESRLKGAIRFWTLLRSSGIRCEVQKFISEFEFHNSFVN